MVGIAGISPVRKCLDTDLKARNKIFKKLGNFFFFFSNFADF